MTPFVSSEKVVAKGTIRARTPLLSYSCPSRLFENLRPVCHLHALHGFLGTKDDWNTFAFDSPVSTYNLFSDFPVAPLSNWAATFNRHVCEHAQPGKQIMVGYSLGGRLGLHAILQNPSLWTAAIFISTHPGLGSDTEKQMKLAADAQWAKRFEEESWNSLMNGWNTQEMFRGDSSFWKRSEDDFDRATLSKALSTWSLGNQNNLSNAIQNLDLPILWMVGENDPKFVRRAQELSFKHPKSQIRLIPDASHRLAWQQPKTFMSYLTQFMHNLEP